MPTIKGGLTLEYYDHTLLAYFVLKQLYQQVQQERYGRLQRKESYLWHILTIFKSLPQYRKFIITSWQCHRHC